MAGFADRDGGPDLLGEHAPVERAGWRICLYVLAVRLVALDEVVSRLRQTVQPCQLNEYGLQHGRTPETRGGGNGPSAIPDLTAGGRARQSPVRSTPWLRSALRPGVPLRFEH